MIYFFDDALWKEQFSLFGNSKNFPVILKTFLFELKKKNTIVFTNVGFEKQTNSNFDLFFTIFEQNIDLGKKILDQFFITKLTNIYYFIK